MQFIYIFLKSFLKKEKKNLRKYKLRRTAKSNENYSFVLEYFSWLSFCQRKWLFQQIYLHVWTITTMTYDRRIRLITTNKARFAKNDSDDLLRFTPSGDRKRSQVVRSRHVYARHTSTNKHWYRYVTLKILWENPDKIIFDRYRRLTRTLTFSYLTLISLKWLFVIRSSKFLQ